MKYENVYKAMNDLQKIKEELGLCDPPSEEKYYGKYITELEMVIDKTIDVLQFQLRTRASELQKEGLVSNKITSVNSVNNLLNSIDESLETPLTVSKL